MALFESGNPTLSEKIFSKSLQGQQAYGQMTVRGSMQKFGFLLLMVVAGAAYTWKLYYSGAGATMMTLFWVGLIGGLVTAFAISFKPDWAKYLAPAYGILEGFVLGGLSAIVNDMCKKNYPNIVVTAILLTFGVAFAVFLLYNFKIIRATEKFKAIILSSMVGIGIFYLIWIVLGFFGVNIPFMQWGDNSYTFSKAYGAPAGTSIKQQLVKMTLFAIGDSMNNVYNVMNGTPGTSQILPGVEVFMK